MRKSRSTLFDQNSPFIKDIATYRLNRPKGGFSENWCPPASMALLFSCLVWRGYGKLAKKEPETSINQSQRKQRLQWRLHNPELTHSKCTSHSSWGHFTTNHPSSTHHQAPSTHPLSNMMSFAPDDPCCCFTFAHLQVCCEILSGADFISGWGHKSPGPAAL